MKITALCSGKSCSVGLCPQTPTVPAKPILRFMEHITNQMPPCVKGLVSEQWIVNSGVDTGVLSQKAHRSELFKHLRKCCM